MEIKKKRMYLFYSDRYGKYVLWLCGVFNFMTYENMSFLLLHVISVVVCQNEMNITSRRRMYLNWEQFSCKSLKLLEFLKYTSLGLTFL